MAELSRVNSSPAAMVALGGGAGLSRSNPAIGRDNRDTHTSSPLVLRPSKPASRGSPATPEVGVFAGGSDPNHWRAEFR